MLSGCEKIGLFTPRQREFLSDMMSLGKVARKETRRAGGRREEDGTFNGDKDSLRPSNH